MIFDLHGNIVLEALMLLVRCIPWQTLSVFHGEVSSCHGAALAVLAPGCAPASLTWGYIDFTPLR